MNPEDEAARQATFARYQRCTYFSLRVGDDMNAECESCWGIAERCPLVNPHVLWWNEDRHLSNEMKNVRGKGPFYFVVHRQKPVHIVTRASMREIDPPYRWGSGFEVRILGRTIGFGLCRRKKFDNDYVAIREALNGRDISTDDKELADEIGDW